MGDPASLACRQHRGAGGVRVRGVGTHHRRQPRRKTSPGSRCSWGRWHRHWLALTQPPSCRYSPGGHRQPARWCALSTGTTGTCRHRAGHRHPPPPPAPPFCNRDVPSRSRCPPKPPQPHHSPSWQGLGQVLLVLRSPQVWGQGGTRALSQPPAPTNTIWGSQPGREGGKQGCSGTGCSPSHPSARPLHPGTLSPPPPGGGHPVPPPHTWGLPAGLQVAGLALEGAPKAGLPPILGGGIAAAPCPAPHAPPALSIAGGPGPPGRPPAGHWGERVGGSGEAEGVGSPCPPTRAAPLLSHRTPWHPLVRHRGIPKPPTIGDPGRPGHSGGPGPWGGSRPVVEAGTWAGAEEAGAGVEAGAGAAPPGQGPPQQRPPAQGDPQPAGAAAGTPAAPGGQDAVGWGGRGGG